MSNHAHNNGPPIIDSHPDDRMKYAPWHIRDFLQGVRGMPPDEIGMYSIIINLIYDNMGRLKDDDFFIAGHCKCEVRYYRKLRQQLLDANKIYEADGYIYNNRAMAEIAKFCTMMQKKRDAARVREEQKRIQRTSKSTPDAHDARLPRAYQAPDAHGLGAHEAVENCAPGNKNDEKSNKNNGAITSALVSALPLLSIYKDKEEDKNKKEPPKPPKGGDPLVIEKFEVWWKAFPNSVRKVGKGDCRELFCAIVAGRPHENARRGVKALRHGKVTADQLIKAVVEYAASMPDPQFVPKPETWLNSGRWQDEPTADNMTTPADHGKPAPMPYWWKGREDTVRKFPVDAWARAVEKYANGTWSEAMLGPPPGATNCLVSDDVIAALKLAEMYDERGMKRSTGAA